jgi:uncharacterized protein (DUF1015 family)
MQILPVPVLFPNFDKIEQLSHFSNEVKHNFLNFQTHQYFQSKKEKSIYIYRIDTPERCYQGIAAAVSISAYLNKTIKGHEETLELKEKKQLELLKDRCAQIKPVLLTYPAVAEIEAWLSAQQINPFLFSFQQGINQHTIWEIHQPDEIIHIQQLFNKHVAQTYIADGHHRTTITAKYAKALGKPLHLYCTLFSSSQVEILSFNRVVEGIPERTLEGLMRHLSQWCIVEPSKSKHSLEKHCLKMYVQQQWYDLTWRASLFAQDPSKQKMLDATLLDVELLHHLMNVDNTRSNNRIHYVMGDDPNFEALTKMVDEDENRVGFCLAPVSVEDFIHLVNEEQLMPPKSTWFKPRMLNGLFVYELEV